MSPQSAAQRSKLQGIKPVRTTMRTDLVACMLAEITVVARRLVSDAVAQATSSASSPSYRQLRPRSVELKGVGLFETAKRRTRWVHIRWLT